MNARRTGAAVAAAIGAIAVGASAYLNWYDGADARRTPLERLYETGIASEPTSYWNSLALPLAVVALLGVLGALLRSRFVLSLGWLVGAAVLVGWAVMSARDDAVGFTLGDVRAGAWLCAVALLVLLAGIVALRGPAAPPPDDPAAPPPDDEDEPADLP